MQRTLPAQTVKDFKCWWVEQYLCYLDKLYGANEASIDNKYAVILLTNCPDRSAYCYIEDVQPPVVCPDIVTIGCIIAITYVTPIKPPCSGTLSLTPA